MPAFAITGLIHLATEQATTGLWGHKTDKTTGGFDFALYAKTRLRYSCKHWITSRKGSKEYLVNVTE